MHSDGHPAVGPLWGSGRLLPTVWDPKTYVAFVLPKVTESTECSSQSLAGLLGDILHLELDCEYIVNLLLCNKLLQSLKQQTFLPTGIQAEPSQGLCLKVSHEAASRCQPKLSSVSSHGCTERIASKCFDNHLANTDLCQKSRVASTTCPFLNF